jgi:hypothetical protein
VLVVHNKWIDLIIAGDKTIELRHHKCAEYWWGMLFPLYSRSAQAVVAVARITGCECLTPYTYKAYALQHKVKEPYESCAWRWAWFISDVTRLSRPVAFAWKHGATGRLVVPPSIVQSIIAQL